MGSVINSVLLENVARANTSKFQNTTVDNELGRAEGRITLLAEKVNEQKKNIDSLQVQLDTLDEARAKNIYILKSPSSESSTSALYLSNKITPPEKERSIKQKGRPFTTALQQIADEQ